MCSTLKKQVKGIFENYSVQTCVVFGTMGFIYAICIIGLPMGQYSLFSEIIIQDKVKHIDTVLDRRIQVLKDTMYKLEKDFLDPKKSVESLKKHNVVASVLKNTLIEKYSLDYGKTDTGIMIFNQYLYPDREKLLNAIRSERWKEDNFSIPVAGFSIDTCRYLSEIPIKFPNAILLTRDHKEHTLDFVSVHPLFGLWIIITIAQMILWFLLFPLITGNVLFIKNTLNKKKEEETKTDLVVKILKNCIVPGFFMVVFTAWLFFLNLADNHIIRGEYFFSGFNTRMILYAPIGYLLAIYSFSILITIAENSTEDDIKRDISNKIRKTFDKTFLASALILSLLVVWFSVNLSALNGLDIFKFYKGLTGRSLISGDLIYLIGLLHTVILLIIYFPAKLKLDSLTDSQTSGAADSSLKKMLTVLSDSLGTLLVTTSPIIASLVHVFFNVIQK